jgi:membrane protein YdbS with pleckstrin-like domain
MEKKEYLIKVRKSRKAYFFLYLMILIVLGALFYLKYMGKTPSKNSLIISFIFIVVLIQFIEIQRFRNWWAITNKSIIQSLGIFNKNVREIGFSSISDLDVDQPFFKRILGFGDVNVRLFLNETSISITDINKPEEFIEELQRVMSMSSERKK